MGLHLHIYHLSCSSCITCVHGWNGYVVKSSLPADGGSADWACFWRLRQRGRGEGTRLQVAPGQEAHNGRAVVHATILLLHPLLPCCSDLVICEHKCFACFGLSSPHPQASDRLTY